MYFFSFFSFKGSNYTYNLCVSYKDSTNTAKLAVSDFGNTSTFTLTTTQTVTVQIIVYPKYELNNVTIYPTLVSGSDAGDFYK